jgi:hypothetical protein
MIQMTRLVHIHPGSCGWSRTWMRCLLHYPPRAGLRMETRWLPWIFLTIRMILLGRFYLHNLLPLPTFCSTTSAPDSFLMRKSPYDVYCLYHPNVFS